VLYLRTIRNLKPTQLVHIPLQRVRRGARRLIPGLVSWRYRRPPTAPVDPRLALSEPAVAIVETIMTACPPDLQTLRQGRLSILGRTVQLKQVDWEEDYRPALWGYHLHYFDDAPALAYAARNGDEEVYRVLRDWVLDWIRRARPGRGPGWDPYPVSQRLVNWAWVDLLLAGARSDPVFFDSLRRSAVQQARFLTNNLEYHLLANHLLKNAKALYVSGSTWSSWSDTQSWCERGLAILRREIKEQILDDGGHFERSPMYHAIVLQDLLEVDLLAQAAGAPSPVASDVLRQMMDVHAQLVHPDGSRARFNDSAEGITRDAATVTALCRLSNPDWVPPKGEVVSRPQMGYYGYRDLESGEAFLIDAGVPGPEHQPAHAHCDLLSFEFYTAGQPWIVDPGVHGYAEDPYRSYARSTAAHNTLRIGDREQSEIWGDFRLGRQARLGDVRNRTAEPGSWQLEAEYSPYQDRRIRHRRLVERKANGEWVILDRVEGCPHEDVVGSLHFHPSVDVSVEGGRLICRRASETLTVTGQNIGSFRFSRGEHRPVSGWFFPKYGVAQDCTTVRYNVAGPESGFSFRIAG
jgi:uncharacterized heparinase superfamily protein